jgi:hypothetical protein
MMSGNFLPKTFWAAACLGSACLFLRPKPPHRVGLTTLGVLWALLNAWVLLSLFWGRQPRVGFERWISLFFLPTVAYLVALRTRFWESSVFWDAYCAIYIVICSIGCLQFILPIEFLKPWLGDQDFLGWISSAAPPSALFGNRNYAGLYLCVSFPFIVWRYFRSEGKRMILPVAAFALGAAFILFTRTRGAWLALLFGVAFMLVCGVWPRVLSRRRKLLAPVIVCVVVFGVAVVLRPSGRVTRPGYGAMPVYKESLLNSVKTLFTDAKKNKRWGIWKFALSARTNPVIGCGTGSLPIVATPHNEDGKVNTLNYEVHCDFLQYYVDLGAVGLLLALAFLVRLPLLGVRQRERTLLLVAGASGTAFLFMEAFTFIAEKVSTYIWMPGVAAMLNARYIERPLVSASVSPAARRWTARGAALLLYALAAVVGFTIWGDRQFQAEVNAFKNSRRIPQFGRLANDVLPKMQFDANMVHIWTHQLAPLATRLKQPDAAEVLARKAAALHPNDVTCLEILAARVAERQEWTRAAGYLERLIGVRGKRAPDQVWLNLIACYQKAGDSEGMRNALARAPESVRTKALRSLDGARAPTPGGDS